MMGVVEDNPSVEDQPDLIRKAVMKQPTFSTVMATPNKFLSIRQDMFIRWKERLVKLAMRMRVIIADLFINIRQN